MRATYWRFELKKRRRVWPVGLITIFCGLLLIGGFFWQMHAQQTYLAQYTAKVRAHVAQTNRLVKAHPELAKTVSGFDTNELKRLKDPAAYQRWFYRVVQVKVKGNQRPGELLNSSRVVFDIGSSGSSLTTSVGWTYQEYHYLNQQHIASMFPDTLLLSKEEVDRTDPTMAASLQTDNRRYYLHGWYYVWFLIQQNAIIVLMLIACLITGRQMAKELTDERAHSDWLSLQGVSTGRQMFTQGGVIAYTFIQVIFGPLAIALVAAGLLRGFGDLRYPVLAFHNTGFGIGSVMMPLSQYLLESIILALLLIIFMTVLNLLLATWFKNSWIVTILSWLVVLLSLIAPPMVWSPLTYFHLDGVVTGSIGQSLNDPQFTFQQGILTLLVWSVFCLGLLILSLFLQKRNVFGRMNSFSPAKKLQKK
jgi:hypothetical protein